MRGAFGSVVAAPNALKRFPSAAWRIRSSVLMALAPPAIGGRGGRALGSKHMGGNHTSGLPIEAPAPRMRP